MRPAQKRQVSATTKSGSPSVGSKREPSAMEILLMLQSSVQNISVRMDNFETVLTGKIEQLENNFDQLNERVNNLQRD